MIDRCRGVVVTVLIFPIVNDHSHQVGISSFRHHFEETSAHDTAPVDHPSFHQCFFCAGYNVRLIE
jgi:hypothetical protein